MALRNPFDNSPANDPIRNNTNPEWDGSGPYEPYGDGSGGSGIRATSIGGGGSSGGGGGIGFIPPVKPNPIFVPPKFADERPIKIVLISEEISQFTENNNNVGVGKSITKTYTTLNFGSPKTYKANVDNKVSKNYFTVNIEKKYKSSVGIASINSTLDFIIPPKQLSSQPINIPPQTNPLARTVIPPTDVTPIIKTSTAAPIIPALNLSFGTVLNDNLSAEFSEVISVKEYEIDASGNYVFSNEKRYEGSAINISLNFLFNERQQNPPPRVDPNPTIDLSIFFNSDFQNELGKDLFLKYEIISGADKGEQILVSDRISLENGSNDLKPLNKELLKNSTVNLSIEGKLPNKFSLKNIYYTSIPVNVDQLFNRNDLSKWTLANQTFSIPGNALLGKIKVFATINQVETKIPPEIFIKDSVYTIEVKDTDTDRSANIMFTTDNAEFVDVYFENNDTIRVDAKQGYANLFFRKDFKNNFGVNRLILAPINKEYGRGRTIAVVVNFVSVDNFPSIIQISNPESIDIPSFSDSNIEYEVKYRTFAATSVDVDLLLKDKTKIGLYKNINPNGTLKINLRDLANKFPNWNGNTNVTLIFKPYSRGGSRELVGNEYEIVTQINYPSIKLDESIIRKSIYDAFLEKLKLDEPEKESKYLTHLANFGDDERILISSYDEDNYTLSEKGTDEVGNETITKEVKSVILKLYTPLPASVSQNSTLWITKLMTNPLIETIILNEEKEVEYPYIKGPNFDIEIDFVKGSSTNYESLDDLILSSSSSNKLIETYLSASSIDLRDLNVEYVSGSISNSTETILWNNFVHFSSAAERINNFVYKVRLIEGYNGLISSASVGQQTGSLAAKQEVQRINSKKSSLIQGFDGFEKLLYTSSSYTTNSSGSLTWPFNGSTRLPSNNINVTKWYERTLGLATAYDNFNSNYLINNIPQHIRISSENENYLLFFSMIGHHFDTIYFYTKAIENSRGMGYKATGGLSDKLIYDLLKSFNWDAKNLGASDQLWKYVFGEDIAGNTSQNNPVKNRTNEVWRRIINNLPYLLKHKGTRRGIHALMACYGIPSSNLSIMEFGGPEITEDTKSKLLIDDTSYALKMKSGNTIVTNAGNIARDVFSVEMFVKPAYSGYHILATDGNGASLVFSGSINSQYGRVYYNNDLSSSLLPIFNGRYVGVCLSNWASYVQLNVMQVEGDREIFYSSTSASVYFAGGDAGFTIGDASSDGFSGSIDEFRAWGTPLSASIFKEHVYYPEMINGNHISASTTDLDFRLDFEYPKNLSVKTKLPNVAPGIKLSSTSSRNYYEDNQTISGLTRVRIDLPWTASAVGFTSISTYPYNFELINRNSVLEIPDLGSSRYSTTKVRFDSQSLVSDLSPKYRSTVKNIENAPIDSNRVGVFVSPNKELNLDIAKSLGSTNMDDYIGDPSDRYKSSYKPLERVRQYYFTRMGKRDIYEYINLIKSYEKAMFDDIKQMLPARVKATTGLLIEPHFLERSKYQYTKPTGSNFYYEAEYNVDTANISSQYNTYDAIVDADLSEYLFGENNQYESSVDANFSEYIFGENNQYESTIRANDDISLIGESNNYDAIINAKLELPTITKQSLIVEDSNKLVGTNDLQDVGFGIYAENGAALRSYYDSNGRFIKERVRVNLITEVKERVITPYRFILPNGRADIRGGFDEPITETYEETKLIIQPYSGSTPPVSGTGNITNVVPIHGYLPTHYKFVSDLTTGMQNSYYRGSKNTAATTLDGSSPVESFISNPNTIKILPGRAATEPILETDT